MGGAVINNTDKLGFPDLSGMKVSDTSAKLAA